MCICTYSVGSYASVLITNSKNEYLMVGGRSFLQSWGHQICALDNQQHYDHWLPKQFMFS